MPPGLDKCDLFSQCSQTHKLLLLLCWTLFLDKPPKPVSSHCARGKASVTHIGPSLKKMFVCCTPTLYFFLVCVGR